MQPMVFGDSLLRSDDWQERLDDLATQHHVPGAQVGLLALGQQDRPDVRVLSTGLTSLSTQVRVTPDTLFQYGSITKVWTTTLIMQLIDEGLLTLETRVVEVLPEFALADPEAAEQVTVRHLLTHTSGIDGDVFTDTGDGDDCVELYVRHLATAASVTQPGGPLSYCNAGFVVAGRLIEVLRDRSWDDVVADRLLRPLGLTHAITRAKDAPLFRTAVGHVKTGEGRDVVPTTTWMFPRAIGPAGLVTGSAETLLRFGAAHLRDGLGLTGERILSADAARRMRRGEVDLTGLSTTQPAWNLGWHQQTWGDETSLAHGGGTIGQTANLQIFPERGLAMVVLTNSAGGGGALVRDVHRLLADELGLTAPQPRIDPGASVADLSGWEGVYESAMLRWEVRRDDDRLWLVTATKGSTTGEPDPDPAQIVPAGPNRFLVVLDGQELEIAALRHAGADYLYFNRLLKRVAPASG